MMKKIDLVSYLLPSFLRCLNSRGRTYTYGLKLAHKAQAYSFLPLYILFFFSVLPGSLGNWVKCFYPKYSEKFNFIKCLSPLTLIIIPYWSSFCYRLIVFTCRERGGAPLCQMKQQEFVLKLYCSSCAVGSQGLCWLVLSH